MKTLFSQDDLMNFLVSKGNITTVVGTVSGSVTPVIAGVYPSFTTALGELLLLSSHHPCLVTNTSYSHQSNSPRHIARSVTSNVISLFTFTSQIRHTHVMVTVCVSKLLLLSSHHPCLVTSHKHVIFTSK